MVRSQPPRGLSPAQLEGLLDRMRRDRPAPGPGKPANVRPDPLLLRQTDFTTLSGFAEMRIQAEVGDALGLRNPYYRLHEQRAGARTRIGGREAVNFASYDYLGLNGHPDILAAVGEATARWGTSVSGSRLTSGERPAHQELEDALAALYGAESALVFVSGHAAAISVLVTLLGARDLVVYDAQMHNCVVLGAQYSGATRRVFPHNDLAALEAILARDRTSFDRTLIVTEGLFSMDGDGPELSRLIEIKQKHACWLMVDDAHGLGVLGRTGRGIGEHAGVDPAGVDIWFGTLSKTLVSCGGYVAGTREMVDYLRYRAPGMVYSVGLPVPAAVAARSALNLMLQEPERVRHLQAMSRLFLTGATSAGFDTAGSWGFGIVPVVIGDALRTVSLAQRLLESGVNAFPVLPPGVPERSARLRFFISAAHNEVDIVDSIKTLVREAQAIGLPAS